jgi:electron transfer flavoprotein beta subunit
MQYKRARAPIEIAAAVAGAMPEASDEEKEVECGRRVERLKMAGLLLEQWNLDDIEADLQWCGMSGSPTKVHRIQAIVLKKQGYSQVPPTQDGVRSMIHELIVDHTWG